jgi:transposase
VDGDVMISIDPHKTSNTAAVLDPATKTVIASQRFANTTAGYRQLRTFGDQWQQRRWAVEGCHGAGRFLAQHLAAEGELVLDVPAKLAARVRVYSQGHGRKTDADDAVSIGLAALNSDVVAAVRADDTLVSLRLLCDRRDELTALRTQAVCRLHRLLVELTPGGTHRGLRAARAQQLLAKLRPVDSVAVVRVQLAHQHLDDIRALDAKMKTVREQIAALVQQTGTRLTDLYGVGPLIAGRIVAEVEDIARFPSRHHFASYNGTAPIDASSGEQVRHRLSRAGNRSSRRRNFRERRRACLVLSNSRAEKIQWLSRRSPCIRTAAFCSGRSRHRRYIFSGPNWSATWSPSFNRPRQRPSSCSCSRARTPTPSFHTST